MRIVFRSKLSAAQFATPHCLSTKTPPPHYVTNKTTMSSQPNLPSPSRLLVLISGNGSNLQALIDACNTPALPHTSIIRVISNRKDAYGLQRAQKADIPTTYHNLVKYKKRHPTTDAGVQAAR